jgi:hypothetical protein
MDLTKNRLSRGTRNMAIATRLNHILCSIRAATRAWLKEQRCNKGRLRANVTHAIQFFDAVEEWRNLSDQEFAFRGICTNKIRKINSTQAKHRRRQAKIKWCTLGEENTSFFHNMATYRYRKNKMKMLCHNQEEFFADVDKLAIVTSYYAQRREVMGAKHQPGTPL